jgi:hypothetical protein
MVWLREEGIRVEPKISGNEAQIDRRMTHHKRYFWQNLAQI